MASSTWRELVENVGPKVANTLARNVADSVDLAQREDSMLTSAFAGCDRIVANGMALRGVAAVRPLVERLHPHLLRARESLDEQDMSGSNVTHSLVNVSLLCECIGMTRPAQLGAASLVPLVAARKEFDDRQKRSLALTALALGDAEAALAFLGQRPRPYDAPMLRFEFNQFELIRYLVAAQLERRPADWLEPAWVEYFELFPMHLAAQAAIMPDLFNFARVLANVRGDDVATLADDVHARVMRAAGS